MISEQKLKELGFQKTFGNTLEDGDYYQCYELVKGEFTICCTNTHNGQTRVVFHQYFELNGETLSGDFMTAARLRSLIKLL
jgi:hypothetical protein